MFNLCNAVSLILLSVGMAGFAPVLAHGSYPSEHTCIHDSHAIQSITKLDLDRNAEILRNSAHDHHRNFGAQGVGNIRFVTRTADLTTAGQYCASAGQTAPNFQGGSATCSSNDVLTASKYSILLNNILPAALQRLSQTVSVTQYSSPIVPTTGACSYFTMPSNDTTNGVSNADFVVYVAAGPTATGVLAWASTCQTDSTSGRPNVGRINFNPAYIAWGDPTNNEMQIATATHELTHALGFSGGFFSTGGRQTTGFKRGKTVTMLITPKVLAVARDFLNCTTLDGVELEDEGTSGSVGSHFERRIYKDELMTAAGGSVHSAMSLAVLEDLGVGYVIDYGPCGNMTFGANAGCAFQSELCNTTAGGRGYWWCFDSNVSNIYCTFDNNAYGSCQVFTSSSALPSYFQYFSDPTVGGPQFMDGCPYVYGGTVCNVATVGTDYTYIAGDTYATDSKCWTVSSGVAQVPYSITSTGTRRCFETSCSSAGKTQFMVNGSSKLTCNSDGAAVSLASVGYSGTAYCPNRTTFCSTPTTTTAAPVTTTTTAASGVTTTKAPTTVAGTTTASTTAAGSTTATSTTGTTTNAGTTTTSGSATTTAVGATTTPSATTVTPPPPSTTTTTTAAAATPTPGSSTCDTSYLLSTSSPSPSSVLSVASINAILTAHNNARRTVSPYAQVMPMLTWNQSLADFAQNYMNTCPGMVHSTSTMRSNVAGFSYIGENLAAGSSNATYGINGGAASTSLWVGEQQYWSYGQVCQSGQVCGHYTQVIWAATLQVGCGWAYCPNQPYLNYWSCNYGPGGNYVGQNEYVSTTTSPSVCQIQTGQTTTTSTPGTLGTTTIGTTAPGATTTAMVPTPPTTTVGPTVTSLPQTDTGSATSMQSTTSSGTTQNGTSIPVLTTTSSSAPQQLTTTAPPVSAPTVAPTRQLVNGVIRIAGTQFNALLSNSTMRTELAAYVALDIARLLGIPVSCVVITSLSIGSLVVNYTVTTDALQTTTSSSVQQAASSATASSSWLVNTSALYAQVAPTETLSVASSTTTSASVTPAPVVGPTTSSPSGGSSSSSSSCGSACIGFYAAIAAAAVLVVGGGIFVLVGRPKRVIPAEDNTPPPTVPTARKPY